MALPEPMAPRNAPRRELKRPCVPWNDALNDGQTPATDGWIGGEAYTLSPAFVWDLSASE